MDRIFHSGIIHTMAGPDAQAVAVKDGRVAAVGPDSEILALAGPGTDLVDLDGTCMLPGFIDSHCHLLSGAGDYVLDLRGTRSGEEIVNRGLAFLEQEAPPEGTWIRLAGYNEDQFDRPALPDRHLLDRISTGHPIVATRICCHVGAANTLALERCGFGGDTVIQGGALDREADGSLSGVLRENALYACMAQVPPCSGQGMQKALAQALMARSRVGITAVHSNDTGPEGFSDLQDAFAALRAGGKQTVRVLQQVTVGTRGELAHIVEHVNKAADDWFSFGCVKLFADGSLGGRTAALREDYSDEPGNRGMLIHSDEEMRHLIATAHRAGLQVAVHAIGDRALEQCTAAIELAQGGGQGDLRHRIVHCQIGDEALYRRMAAASICADIQPPFLPTDGPVAGPRLGSRTEQSYAWRTLLELGVPLAGGSDSPVEPFDPLWGIYCAVTRQNRAGQPDGGWLPQQRLSVVQAVEIYTRGGAYMAHREDQLGTVEPGKLADFVVLDRDLLAIPHREILETKVVMTVVNGVIVYSGRE